MTREWRGVTLDNRSAAMMDEVARLCPGIALDPMQGSYSHAQASAGTHSGGGAIDLWTNDWDKVVYEMRRVGWAAWHRTPAQGFDHHIHGIAGPAGPGDLPVAASDQWADYLAGRNGLANNAPDDGPRDFVGVTWELYQQGKDNGPDRQDEEEIDMLMILRAPNGAAYLLWGAYTATGIYGEAIHQYEAAGVPTCSVPQRDFDAMLVGREIRAA